MARKNVIQAFKMIEDGDMSSNITSSVTNVENLDKAAILVEWTSSSINGVITVEARHQKKETAAQATWYELDFGAAITVTTDNSSHQIVLNELPFTDIRVVYTATSGTGTLNATITSKTVGA